MPFMPEFEDTYRPSFAFRNEASGIAVLPGSTRLGLFDDSRPMFTRLPDGTAFQSAEIHPEPPGSGEQRSHTQSRASTSACFAAFVGTVSSVG